MVVVVIRAQPHPLYYGGVVAAPVFSKVARDALRYLDIKPERLTEVKREVEISSVED